MQAILVKQLDNGAPIFCLVADKLPENYTLNQQNCLQVEQYYTFGFIDIDSIASAKYPDNENMPISKRYENGFKQIGFIESFNLLKGIISDKNFTREDVLNAFIEGIKLGELKSDPAFATHNFGKHEQDFIDFLDTKEFKVEIVTELRKVLVNGYKNQPKGVIGFIADYEIQEFPVYDEQGNLILKPVI